MPKAILVCGKICSGKSHYIKRLQADYHAVVLSCDELIKALFDAELKDQHDVILDRLKEYLYGKSLEILAAGASVILDFGFWTKAEREKVSGFYRSHGVELQWHYISISEEDWLKNIAKRNREVTAGVSSDYYVDDGLLCKLNGLFEVPERAEIDVWYENRVR
jgi:predicted kinase